MSMEYFRPKKIFIVDDDAMLTEALTDYLTRKVAHVIHSFQTGEECLRHLDDMPDFIVLDYFLNSVEKNAANGLEILQAIHKYNPTTSVIMLSNQEKYSTALKSIQNGAVQYVIKDEEAFEKIEALVNETT